MNKYIFLDIDGVLATPDYQLNGLWAINPAKQDLLGDILRETGAKIVLSSSWRLHTLEDTKNHMTQEGFQFSDDIVGVTIRAYQYIDRKSKIHLSIPRGVEIKQWIDTNVHSDNGKNFDRKTLDVDYTYVILDDGTDMLLEQKDHFINTNPETGLTKEESLLAIKLLNH